MIDFQTLCHEIQALLVKDLPLSSVQTKERSGALARVLFGEEEAVTWMDPILTIIKSPQGVTLDLPDDDLEMTKASLLAWTKMMVGVRCELYEQAQKKYLPCNAQKIWELLEFFDLPKDFVADPDTTQDRYNNIQPAKHSVVHKTGDSFFNGNFLPGNTKPSAIVTQAPILGLWDDTREMFWEIVWEQRVPVIMMLTRLVEGDKEKATIYWPEKDDNFEWGSLTVSGVKEEKKQDGMAIRELLIEKDGKSRTVYQVQYTNWPDRSAPKKEELDTLFAVEKECIVKAKEKNQGEEVGPKIVHCSAGIGRTGAYWLSQRIKELNLENEPEHERIFSLAAELLTARLYRPGLVQTEAQWNCVVEKAQSVQSLQPPARVLGSSMEGGSILARRKLSCSTENSPPKDEVLLSSSPPTKSC